MAKINRPISARAAYWLDPIFLVTLATALSAICFAAIPAGIFQTEFRQPKYPTSEILEIYTFTWATLVSGMVVARLLIGVRARNGQRSFDDRWSEGVIRRIAGVALWLSLAGYGVYFATSTVSPATLLAAVQGEPGANYVLRDSFENMPGVTSFMNLAPWWFVWIAYRSFVQQKRLTHVEIAATAVLLIASLVRGFAVNERRVIFEILLPAVVFVILARREWSSHVARLIRWAPIIGLMVLGIVFCVTEYFRSWVNFWSERTELSYIEWALTRLGGYYATALNNGYALLGSDLQSKGMLTFSGITKLPIVSDVFGFSEARIEYFERYRRALEIFTNREFNNPGGAVVALIDFGWIGGGLILFVTGTLVGSVYYMARQGNLFAALMFLPIFFALLEITRVFAFFSPSGLLNILFVFGCWLILGIRKTSVRIGNHPYRYSKPAALTAPKRQ